MNRSGPCRLSAGRDAPDSSTRGFQLRHVIDQGLRQGQDQEYGAVDESLSVLVYDLDDRREDRGHELDEDRDGLDHGLGTSRQDKLEVLNDSVLIVDEDLHEVDEALTIAATQMRRDTFRVFAQQFLRARCKQERYTPTVKKVMKFFSDSCSAT